ncbi:MAG TPA: helicase Snf2 [Planctomycetales bacterium]|jgi:SNF2 family DNA or RNA helicase|nr:helicase Snf2 [Planctomycetales bacterium]
MLREKEIDIRRNRAAKEGFSIQNLGRNRVFSDYKVTNLTNHHQYRVSIRGFDVGDNRCECPDFLANTLGTCKHIEAVLISLRDETPPQLRRRKAAVTHPEIYLQYTEQLRVGIHLPPRHSDQLHALAETFFDGQGLWKAEDHYQNLIEAVAGVPEQVTTFSDAMQFMEGEIERQEMAGRERDWLNQLEREEPSPVLCDLLKVPLYPYQMRGALFLACRGRCVLGDDMGLGKTVQTLAAVELLARERGVERVLVVAPASVKYQWETEIQKYTGRPVQVVEGNAAERRARYKQPTFYRLINYETVVRDLQELNAWQPDLIVLDEAQRIKNWESKTSKAVKRLCSRYAVVLTGTPLENKLEELFSIVAFVDERRLGPAFQFRHDHRVEDANGKLLGYRNLDALREKLAPILLRRTRAEVLSQLPARTDTTVYVEMAAAQRPLYAEHQATLGRILQKKYLTELDRRRILCCIANLRMLCDSTFLLDHQTNVSPKLEEVAELLRELLGPEPHKVVVFSQWEVMLRKAAEVVEQLGVGHTILHGNIPGKDRRKLLEKFRDDPECRVFLSTDAGGTGLNLQAADTVINLEVPWNPAVLDQRIARVHRMGQHRPVQVFNLVTRDSIEERVLRTLEQKRSLLTEIFAGGNDEVAFGSLGHQAFLETVRQLVGEEAVQLTAAAPPPTTDDARLKLAQAGVQLLEALATVMAESTRKGGPTTLPAETLQRGTAALQTILKSLGTMEGPA